jgi:aconitase A
MLVETYAKTDRPLGRCARDRAVRAHPAFRPFGGRAPWPAHRIRTRASRYARACSERGIAGNLEAARTQEAQGLMPDGAVIIAAITSCTNTSNPRNVIAAALLARNANAKGLGASPG